MLELVRHRPRFFPTPGEIRAAVVAAAPLALPAPEHRLFSRDPRSLEEVAERRRRLAPLWGEVRRVATGGQPRPIAAVLRELGIEEE